MKIYRVAEIITPTKLILNCGKDNGIEYNMRFVVYSLTKPIIDPETGEELEKAEIIKGFGKVVHLQNKICTIESYQKISSGNKVIKKIKPFGVFSGATEEEVYALPELKEFEDVEIGDYARLIE